MKLTPAQHEFLGLWVAGDPSRNRAKWLRAGRVLRPVAEPFAYPDDLEPGDRIQAYRLGDGGETFKGNAENRRNLSVAAFRELADCWTIPLRALSPLGLELASAPAPILEPMITRNFRLPADLDRALDRLAQAEGRDASAVLRDLVAAYLENRKWP